MSPFHWNETEFFRGERAALSRRKRPALGIREGETFRFGNVRAGDGWYELPVTAGSIASLDLSVKHELAQPDHAHLMLLVRFTAPIQGIPAEGAPARSFDSLLLTVNPHEIDGAATTGRQDSVHQLVFRALDGRALERSFRRERTSFLTHWRTNTSPAETLAIFTGFTKRAGEISGAERFHYTEHNCAGNLWDVLFRALPRLAPTPEQITASRRGKNAPTLARDLGWSMGAAYPFGRSENWVPALSEALVRHLNEAEHEVPAGVSTHLNPKRNPLLQLLFNQGALRRDWVPFLLGDKLLAARLAEAALGAEAFRYYPKCRGVKEILESYALVHTTNGRFKSPDATDQLRAALAQEFPDGFVLKATQSFGSRAGSVITGEEKILRALTEAGSDLYDPAELARPFTSPEFHDYAPASGERYFFMAKLKASVMVNGGPARAGSRATEFRAHTYGPTCLEGGIMARWDVLYDETTVHPAIKDFLEDFLFRMPPGFAHAQGYAFDLYLAPGESPKIIEINTNRGRAKFWSDFLKDPAVLQAHATALEQKHGWQFTGEEGRLLRDGLANLWNHVTGDLAYLLAARDDASFRADYWLAQIARNEALLRRALAAPPAPDKFSYHADLAPFARAYLEAAEGVASGDATGPAWERFLSFARAHVAQDEASRK